MQVVGVEPTGIVWLRASSPSTVASLALKGVPTENWTLDFWLRIKGFSIKLPGLEIGWFSVAFHQPAYPSCGFLFEWLPRKDSHPHKLVNSQPCYFHTTREWNGSHPRTRTWNHLINSQALYHWARREWLVVPPGFEPRRRSNQERGLHIIVWNGLFNELSICPNGPASSCTKNCDRDSGEGEFKTSTPVKRSCLRYLLCVNGPVGQTWTDIAGLFRPPLYIGATTGWKLFYRNSYHPYIVWIPRLTCRWWVSDRPGSVLSNSASTEFLRKNFKNPNKKPSLLSEVTVNRKSMWQSVSRCLLGNRA